MQASVRTAMVVELQMLVEVCLKLGARAHDLPVQKLVAQLVEKALDVAVLPGRARLDESRLDPFRKIECPKLGAVVRNQPLWFAILMTRSEF